MTSSPRFFKVRSPAQGLAAIEHPVITKNWKRSLRWRPKNMRAVLVPCAGTKPFPDSPSHAHGYLPAIGDHKVDVFVVSEPLGVVPYSWSRTYPNDAYDFPPAHLRGPGRDLLVERIAKWFDVVGAKYDKITMALPGHHKRLVDDALAALKKEPTRLADAGMGACLDSGACPTGHYRATTESYRTFLAGEVAKNPGHNPDEGRRGRDRRARLEHGDQAAWEASLRDRERLGWEPLQLPMAARGFFTNTGEILCMSCHTGGENTPGQAPEDGWRGLTHCDRCGQLVSVQSDVAQLQRLRDELRRAGAPGFFQLWNTGPVSRALALVVRRPDLARGHRGGWREVLIELENEWVTGGESRGADWRILLRYGHTQMDVLPEVTFRARSIPEAAQVVMQFLRENVSDAFDGDVAPNPFHPECGAGDAYVDLRGRVSCRCGNTTGPLYAVGDRVRLRDSVDRYPHFVAPVGATGTVVGADKGLLRVRLDQHLRGAEEWDNEVHWFDSLVSEARAQLEPVSRYSVAKNKPPVKALKGQQTRAWFGADREPVLVLGQTWANDPNFWTVRFQSGEEGTVGGSSLYTVRGEPWRTMPRRRKPGRPAWTNPPAPAVQKNPCPVCIGSILMGAAAGAAAIRGGKKVKKNPGCSCGRPS